MKNENDAFLDSKVLDGINNNLSSLRSKINGVWSGIATTAFDSSFSDIISSIDKVDESINIFNSALEKIEIHKSNKTKIADLEQLISNERAHPSLSSTESYVENGVIKSRVIYVVNQALINEWQAQINLLVTENNKLKNEIIALLNSIVPINIKTMNNIDISNRDFTLDDIYDNSIVSGNIKAKNNSDISHRGYTPGGIYDNSAEGFILAGEKGFWGCETDVRFDSNGNLVCSHNAVEKGQNPTSFEEYLDICKEYGMTAIIDLKYENGVGPADPNLSPAILKTIQEKGMMDVVFYKLIIILIFHILEKLQKMQEFGILQM